MKKKRNSVVTVRLPDDLMLKIAFWAKERDWTISHTVFRLIEAGLFTYDAVNSAQEVCGDE